MRIAIVDLLFSWPPSGGARTDVREVALRLGKDHEVKIFVPCIGGNIPRGQFPEDPGVPVEAIPFREIYLNFWHTPRMIRRAVDAWKPDRVYIADGWYLKPYVVWAFRDMRPVVKLFGYEGLCLLGGGIFYRDSKICPHRFLEGGIVDMVRCQICGFPLFKKEFLGSLVFLPTYRSFVRKALASAKKIIVNNKWARELLKNINTNVDVITPGVDAELFTPGENNNKDGARIILMVGRIEEPSKGFSILREACDRLRGEGANFRLMVTAKADSYHDRLIENVGWLTQEKLAQVYKKVDICVVPSLMPEAFGIVALEAMSAERPVVVSNVGGLGGIVKDGITGYVIPPGDVDALTNRLRTLLADENLRSRMGKQGRTDVLENYTWDVIYERHYKRIFAGE